MVGDEAIAFAETSKNHKESDDLQSQKHINANNI